MTKTTTDAVFATLAAGGGVAHRRSQRLMASRIEQVVSTDAAPRVAVLEAPTGTGKSLGYLAGALPAALASGKTVIVATATIALQRQLLESEVPRLAAAGLEVRAAMLKGRNRYVCPRNLLEHAATNSDQGELLPGDAGPERMDSAPVSNEVTAILAALERGTFSGDLDEWTGPLAPEALAAITTPREGCLGSKCPHVNACPLVAARRQVKSANLIVTNQALLLLDLLVGDGALLGKPEDTVLIVDEGHQLEGNAMQALTARVGVRHVDRWLTRLRQDQRYFRAATAEDFTELDALNFESRLGELRDAWLAFTRLLNASLTPQALDAADVPVPASLLDEASTLLDEVAVAADRALTLARRMRQSIAKGVAGVRGSPHAKLIGRLGPSIERLQTLGRLASNLHDLATDPSLPIAAWMSRDASGQDVTLAAGQFHVGGLLRTRVFDRLHASVVTSATLTALSRFDRLGSALGLTGRDAAHFEALPSPFDLARQAKLIVRADAPDPKDPRHASFVASVVLEQAVAGRGVLVLFTAWSQLRAVRDLLPPSFRDRVLCQGDVGLKALLDRHAERVRRGEVSVLFGVQGMAEGLDLPGALCAVVVVAKLPFAAPDDPIERARERWLANQGRSYFGEIALPEAHRRLTQWLGRLIRTETDEGTLVVCDPRLAHTQYGRRMLSSLPPFSRVIEGGVSRQRTRAATKRLPSVSGA